MLLLAGIVAACGGDSPSSAASTAGLQVSVSTDGIDADPNGYLLALSAGPSATPLPLNGSVTIDGLTPGSYELFLDDVSVNCPVEGGQLREAILRASETTTVEYAISCEPAGVIVFSSDRVGQSDIWRMGGNGAGLTRLTFDPATDSWPRWSPDGRIAFLSFRGGGPDHWLMDGVGRKERRLTFGLNVRGFAEWSPDGSRLAFHVGPGMGLSVVGADGTDLRLLEPRTDAAAPFRVAWSPDGEWIAFTGRVDDGPAGTRHTFFRIRADGTGRERLGQVGVDEFGPDWSPDGLAIAFTTAGTVAIMAPDGSGRVVLAQGILPRWSPDGEWLAFTSDRTGTVELYVARRDGSDERQLSSGGGGEPEWSADGRIVVYQCGADVCAVRGDGANRSRLTTHPGNDRRASFGPPAAGAGRAAERSGTDT